jgi:hypothetical protein
MMKFKNYLFLSAMILGAGSLFAAPAMADYNCFGKNIAVTIYGAGWNASYEGRARSGTIFLSDVINYVPGSRIDWNNGGYTYRVLINSRGKPYRVRVYKPNGRRIVNKRLSCSWTK